MGIVIKSKTFKSGNSVAVRLPRELGFVADVPVIIEQNGWALTIRPQEDAAEERLSVERLVAALRALDPIEPPGRREPIEIPDRPGLY